ncbi:MAG: polyprenyl synthetase family protein [Lachnospiraceae bacterium]|nr:polyprenyl synthetase family protein [Lachnospiraceae bacterium]
MLKSDLTDNITKRVSVIEDVLKKYLPKTEGYQQIIFEAMEYSLMAGGKRLRPMIMEEVYRLYGGSNNNLIEPFMAAIEMIHTYSLVHDDLPAMDNDEYRRGRKTTHVVYGEDMGILTGDALLNYAYETATKSFEEEVDIIKAAKAMKILTEKAGIHGMVGGQVVDVKMNGKVPDADMLDFIYRLKTGALLEASFMIGGVLAGASESDVSTLKQIAQYIGVAFQIQDDILDVTSTTEVLGKPVGSDEKNEKSTYVSFNGLDNATKAVKSYTNEAVALLEELDLIKGPDFLRDLLVSLTDRIK